MRLSAIATACLLGLSLNAFAADVKSISRLAAGPGDTLFVADWKSAQVHAIKLAPASRQATGEAFNILDLETLLSAQVGGARVTVVPAGIGLTSNNCAGDCRPMVFLRLMFQ